MKRVRPFTYTIFSIFCVMGSLPAESPIAMSEPRHVPVGERRLSATDKALLQEERWQQIKEFLEEKEIPVQEEGIVPEEIDLSTQPEGQPPLQARMAGLASLEKEASVSHGLTTYHIQHPGCYHFPALVAWDGSTVELHNGSVWTIHPSDRIDTLNWFTGDTILITQNNDLFSLYDYKSVNYDTGVSVRCNLTLGPIYNGMYTYWITWIDYDSRLVFLNDGSYFQVSIWDASSLDQWLENDTLIIGANGHFDKHWNPHILINVTWGGHAKAEQKY